jgi:predicted dehydrogenase
MLGSASSLEIETEDTASILTEFTDGILCEFHLDYVQRAYSRSCHVIGEEGTIRWEWDRPAVRRYDPDEETWIEERSWGEEWTMNQMYISEMEHFLRCVLDGRRTRSSLKDGWKDLRFALEAKKSARNGTHREI